MAAFDPLIIRLDNWISGMRQRRHLAVPEPAPPISDYIGFMNGAPIGRALVCLSITKLRGALETKSYSRFNSEGFSLEIVRALNERRFIVDVVDYQDRDFSPMKHYDIVITHGNYNACRILDRLPSDVISIAYESGCAQDEFERQTNERYQRFESAHPSVGKGLIPSRIFDHDDLAAVRRVSAVLCLGELTRQTLLPHNPNCFSINNSAVVNSEIKAGSRPRDFVCVAGTGNIQKGIDLVISAFAEIPEATLYLASVIEPDVLRGLKSDLKVPNIRYVHHRRRNPLLWKWLRERCAFTILCGMNSGQSTALVGCLGEGYIPVVNAEANMGLSTANSILIEGNEVPCVKDAVRRAIALSDEKIATLSNAALSHFESEFSVAAFRKRIGAVLHSILDKKYPVGSLNAS